MPIVEATGREGGATYLMIHGSPIDHHTWRPLAGRAPGEVRVALLALLDHPPQPEAPQVTLADYEADIADAVRSLDGPVILVGHSLGAYLAVQVARTLGERIRRLVLVAGLDRLPAENAAGMRAMLEGLEAGAMSIEQLRAAILDLWLGDPPHDEAQLALLRRSLEGIPARQLARQTRRILELAQPAAALTPFDTPATIIHARGDRAVPYALGESLSRLGRRAELIPMDGSSHFLQVTAAPELARWTFEAGR